MSELKVTDFVQKDVRVYFDSFRAGVFYYWVEHQTSGEQYQFQVPIEEVGNATLNARDKSVMFMRWIRKGLEDKTMVKIPK